MADKHVASLPLNAAQTNIYAVPLPIHRRTPPSSPPRHTQRTFRSDGGKKLAPLLRAFFQAKPHRRDPHRTPKLRQLQQLRQRHKSAPPQLNYQLPPQLQLAYVEGSPPQITSLPPQTHNLSATQHYQPRRARYFLGLRQMWQPQLRRLSNNSNVGSTSIHSREMFPNLTQQATPLQQTAECSHLCCKCSNILILVHLTGQIAN